VVVDVVVVVEDVGDGVSVFDGVELYVVVEVVVPVDERIEDTTVV